MLIGSQDPSEGAYSDPGLSAESIPMQFDVARTEANSVSNFIPFFQDVRK